MNARFILSMASSAVAVGLLVNPSAASASTCTFTSSSVLYHQTYSGQTLTFSWDSSTNALLAPTSPCSASTALSGGTAYWDDLESGVTHARCGKYGDPGSLSSSFSPTGANSETHVILNFTDGYISALLSNNAVGGTIAFAGVLYGTHNSLISGYGTVSCSP